MCLYIYIIMVITTAHILRATTRVYTARISLRVMWIADKHISGHHPHYLVIHHGGRSWGGRI